MCDLLVSSLPAVSMAVSVFAQSGAASVTLLAMLVLIGLSSAQDSGECANGIDVTSAQYGADPTGAADSSSAFNTAIIAAGGAGALSIACCGIRGLIRDRWSCRGHQKWQRA